MPDRTFRLHDTTLLVTALGTGKATIRGKNGRRIEMGHVNPDRALFVKLLRTLRALGFSIEDDPKIVKHYPSLASRHRVGRRGDLQYHAEVYPAGCDFTFFQDVVKENPNGGRYDFDKLTKMPYPVRKSFERAINGLVATLRAEGLSADTKVESPNPDPLAHFNDKWDMGEKRRGTVRFDRDETGWPSEKALSFWRRTDADGAVVRHGDVRLARDHKGYLRRGRVYGGINGMWMLVFGPGKRDATHCHVAELFSWREGLARKAHPDAMRTLKRAKERAVAAEDYEKAARLRDALARMTARAAAEAARHSAAIDAAPKALAA